MVALVILLVLLLLSGCSVAGSRYSGADETRSEVPLSSTSSDPETTGALEAETLTESETAPEGSGPEEAPMEEAPAEAPSEETPVEADPEPSEGAADDAQPSPEGEDVAAETPPVDYSIYLDAIDTPDGYDDFSDI